MEIVWRIVVVPFWAEELRGKGKRGGEGKWLRETGLRGRMKVAPGATIIASETAKIVRFDLKSSSSI